MAPGIPGEKIEAGQVQFIHQVGNTPGMLVAAVEQQYGLAWGSRFWGAGPVAVKQLHTVVGGEGLFLCFAHCHFLRLKSCRFVLP